MALIRAHRKQFLLAGPLAVAVTALTVTACGGGNAASVAPGGSPGQWTQAEVSQFAAAAIPGGSASGESCALRYVKQDMSFGNAMAVASVDPASDAGMSAAQVQAAVLSKYGAAEGKVINAQFGRAATDADNNCGGPATSSAPAAAAPASTAAAPASTAAAPASTADPAATSTADPAATSESSCTVDCTNPVASGESGWLAQVQPALQNVQQDLTSISSDATSDPGQLVMDGAQLDEDATAALDPNDDPPPADDADWTTAMNDYVTAGEDYSDENVNSQDDNPAQASQEITAGNSALAGFNAANGGVLNGIIQS